MDWWTSGAIATRTSATVVMARIKALGWQQGGCIGVTRLVGDGGAAGGGGKGDIAVNGGGAMGGRPTSCQWLQAFTK